MASATEALIVVAVAFVVVYVSLMWLKQRNLNLPPGPTAWPIIGSLHLLGTHPHQSLADLARKYGPVISVRLGQKLCIVATSPDAAKEILKHQDANFSSRPPSRAAELILPKDLVLHDLTPDIRHLRKLFVTELTSAKRLEASKHIRTEEIGYILRAISKETGPIDVRSYLNIVTTNVLSRMVLSRRFLGGGDNQSGEPASAQNVADLKEFLDISREVNSSLGGIDPQDFFNFIPKWFDPQGLNAHFRKIAYRLDSFCTNMINQHKEKRRKNPISEGQQTLLDVLLEQLDNPGYDVTEAHVKCLIWDALAAGTDTTVLTSEWAMAEVLRNPAIVKVARSELDRVVGLNRTVQESDIPELKHIQAIVKEALRLHPAAPLLIPHRSINPAKAFGYDIPADTRVFVNAWAMGRDPALWEKPLEFAPERFVDGAAHETTQFQGQHFELIPFGAGRRLCPGLGFASVAVHFQVASLLHSFDWSFPDGMAPQKLDMTEAPYAVTLRKRHPLLALALPRLARHLYHA